MLDNHKILRNLRKIKKLYREEGAEIALKKIAHISRIKITRNADMKTRIKRDIIFKNVNLDALTADIDNYFSNGLIRSIKDIRSDVIKLPNRYAGLLIDEANDIIKNEFVIYGHMKVKYDSDSLIWSRDPLSGFIWPQKLSHYYFMNKKPYGIDIKTIWEVARFQFLSFLSYAHIITGRNQYARCAYEKIMSWIDTNPFQSGPHWTMPMESSIRLINWCFYIPLLEIFKYAVFSDKKIIVKSILEHLIYIRYNLEVSPSQSDNHYLANLVGLILSQLLFPSLTWARENTEYAINEFGKEVQNQFKNSGINFEGSLPYHRLSSEMILIGFSLIKRIGAKVPAGLIERLKQVSTFTKYYTSLSYQCPVIGDNDSGICLKYFPGQESNRHGYLRFLFDFILGNREQPKDLNEYLCSINYGISSLPIKRRKKRHNDARSMLKVSESDGLIMAYSGSNGLYFNTLKSSKGHVHNDKLAVYPVIGKKLLFIDRGSFSYSGYPNKRHEDRRSSSHNGPLVNGWEQNIIWENDLFYNNGDARCFNSIKQDLSKLIIKGWHVGYKRFCEDIYVFRKIKWEIRERTILITDWLEGKKANKLHKIQWYFLINPAWTLKTVDEDFVLLNKGRMVSIEDVDGVKLSIVQGRYCPKYQYEKHCEALAGSVYAKSREKIRFVLRY